MRVAGVTALSSILVIAFGGEATGGHPQRALSDAASAVCAQPPAGNSPDNEQILTALSEAHAKFKTVREGRTPGYSPVLASAKPSLFGLVVVTVDGQVIKVGDALTQFPIESLSTPFNLALLIEEQGPRVVEHKIGLDATGQPNNSVAAIEMNKREHPAGNPLVTAGAIVTISLIGANTSEQRASKVLANLSKFAGRSLSVNEDAFKSEVANNAHNEAITRLLKNFEVLGSAPAQALDTYTKACSVSLNTVDLATMGATLANGGVNPITSVKVVSPDVARRTVAQLATNGMYEATGEWLYKVGLPAKSGIGGGIVAIVPGKFAIAAFSPPLDEAGNSVRAQKAIEHVVNKLGVNLYASKPAVKPSTGGSGRPSKSE